MSTAVIGIICGVGAVAVIILAWLIRKNMKQLSDAVVYEQPDEDSFRESAEEKQGSEYFAEKLKALENGRFYQYLYLPEGDEATALPQSVFVSTKGIFLLEYMDVCGWVLGREDSRWWTHFVSMDEKDFLDNPIWRADDAIATLIGFFPKTYEQCYQSYIVFSDQCELRSIELWGNVRVVNDSRFMRTLNNDFQTLPDVFTDETLDQMLRVMDELKNPDGLEERLEALKLLMSVEKQQDKAFGKGLSQRQVESSKRIRHLRPEDHFTRPELALRDALILWRKQEAMRYNITEFEIFDNRTLDQIVFNKPRSMKALLRISGMDMERCELFGKAIMSMIEHAPQD